MDTATADRGLPGGAGGSDAVLDAWLRESLRSRFGSFDPLPDHFLHLCDADREPDLRRC